MSRLKTRLSLYAACAAAISVVILLVAELNDNSREAALNRFNSNAAIITAAVKTKIDELQHGARDVSAFVKFAGELSPYEISKFLEFTEYFQIRNHQRAMAIMPLVEPEHYGALEQYLARSSSERQQLSYPAWTWERPTRPRLVAPAVVVESNDGREGVLGYDIATSADRLQAVRRSQSLGVPQLTRPVRLSQDNGTDYASVLIVDTVERIPFFDGGPDTNVVVAIGFTPEIALQGLLSESKDFDIELLDITENPAIALLSNLELPKSAGPLQSNIIETGGRRWQLKYYPTAAFESDLRNPWILGLSLTIPITLLLLTLALDRLIITRANLEIKVSRRTAALESANLMLTEAMEKATLESKAKTDFLARMSHDLRTPLNAIIGYASMIQSQMFGPVRNDTYMEYIDNIERAGQMQLRLVDDVLAYSALQEDVVENRISQFEPATVLSAVVDVMRLQADERDLEVHLDCDPSIGTVVGDHGAFEQIATNIISNAVKYTPDGGVIRVGLRSVDHQYVLDVKDTGMGIPKDELRKVLEPFTRLDENPYVTSEGFGLGLSIVQKLVELNRGAFRIESEVGVGTQAIVTFPMDFNNPSNTSD